MIDILRGLQGLIKTVLGLTTFVLLMMAFLGLAAANRPSETIFLVSLTCYALMCAAVGVALKRESVRDEVLVFGALLAACSVGFLVVHHL